MKLFKWFRVKWKCFLRQYKLMNQYCKRCGKDMHYDFSVSDNDWSRIPVKYQNHVLCLECFMEVYPEADVDIELFLIK